MTMTLGGYTFARNPAALDGIITPQRHIAVVDTYGGVAVFSWGLMIEGTRWKLMWQAIPAAMWDELDTLYQADASVVWNPDDGESKTYNVQIMSLIGSYFMQLAGSSGHRQNVVMELLITSEV